MALSTYAELASAVTSFSIRADRAGDIDTYISLAEEAIYNGIGDVRPLRVQGMVTSTSTGLPTIPADFLEAIRLTTTASGDSGVLVYLPKQNLAALSGDSAAAQYFTIIGDQIETARSTITDYVLTYYKRFAQLSGSAPTNWILTNAPGIYLHGCLMVLYRMTRDKEGEQSELASFGAAMNALKNRDYAAQYRGSILQVRAN